MHAKDNLCHVHEYAEKSLSKRQSCNLSLAFVVLVEKLPPPGWSDDSGMTAGHCEEPDPALPMQKRLVVWAPLMNTFSLILQLIRQDTMSQEAP